MEYFIAVCDCGGITPAAEALFLTPQALSKSIRKLELELESPLFSRENGGFSLTPFGKKALAEIRQFIDSYHNMQTHLRQISLQEKGRIRISCAFGIPKVFSLEELQSDASDQGIHLDIIELPDLLVEELVQQEVADIGFIIGPPQAPELFHATFLRRFYLCAVVNRLHPLADRPSISIRDLAGEKVLAKSPYFASYHIIEQEAKRQGVELSYALSSPDQLRYIQLLQENQGIGIGLSFVPLRVSQNTVLLPLEEELPWDVYLITRKGHYLSPAAQALLERLQSMQEPND